MSLPGSSNLGPVRGEGSSDATLVTVMFVVAAIFLIAGTIILSIPLKDYYDKFFWNFR
jgi:hypothetical protein